MTIVCRTCGHKFRRAHIVRPRTLQPWDCPKKRCVGYGTIETLAETLARIVAERKPAITAVDLGGYTYHGSIADGGNHDGE